MGDVKMSKSILDQQIVPEEWDEFNRLIYRRNRAKKIQASLTEQQRELALKKIQEIRARLKETV
jgi:hypothetical protein